ncbi:hypothetical protein CR513_07048, partial [Mucuna pruriens]
MDKIDEVSFPMVPKEFSEGLAGKLKMRCKGVYWLNFENTYLVFREPKFATEWRDFLCNFSSFVARLFLFKTLKLNEDFRTWYTQRFPCFRTLPLKISSPSQKTPSIQARVLFIGAPLTLGSPSQIFEEISFINALILTFLIFVQSYFHVSTFLHSGKVEGDFKQKPTSVFSLTCLPETGKDAPASSVFLYHPTPLWDTSSRQHLKYVSINVKEQDTNQGESWEKKHQLAKPRLRSHIWFGRIVISGLRSNGHGQSNLKVIFYSIVECFLERNLRQQSGLSGLQQYSLYD